MAQSISKQRPGLGSSGCKGCSDFTLWRVKPRKHRVTPTAFRRKDQGCARNERYPG
jgi:hypothetical protein